MRKFVNKLPLVLIIAILLSITSTLLTRSKEIVYIDEKNNLAEKSIVRTGFPLKSSEVSEFATTYESSFNPAAYVFNGLFWLLISTLIFYVLDLKEK